MTDRERWTAGRLAALAAGAVALTALGLATSVWTTVLADRSVSSEVVNDLLLVGSVIVGVVIVAARPGNRVGWVMLLGGVCAAVGSASIGIAQHGLVDAPGSVLGAGAFAVVGQILRSLGWLALTTVVAVLFPDGRVAGPRWRWLYRALAVVAVASVLDPVLDRTADLTGLGGWRNPLAPSGAWQVINLPVFLAHIPLTVVVTVAAVVQLIQLWRRGDEMMRQQLFVFACAAALPAVAAPIALSLGGGGWIFGVTSAPLPIAIGFAILARGLYDLRTGTNRTLVWLTLSITVAGLFAVVIGLGGVLGASASTPWLPWLAAGVVAGCFAPLRDVLQRGINRLTYGRWTEPYELLAALGEQLEAASDIDRLLDGVVAELESLGLRDVRIIENDEESDADEDMVVVPLRAYGVLIGTFQYRQPDPPVRARDTRVIANLAGHLGSVLNSRILTHDLQRARERLVLGREEERRRLRRDLHDGLGPALAGHLLRLDLIAGVVAPDSTAGGLVDALRTELRDTVSEVRRVVEGLRPPALDELGLVGALSQASSRLVAGSGVTAQVRADLLPPLPAATEVAAYRIATEGLTNAVKHARATLCTIDLCLDENRLVLWVRDNGTGLGDVASGRGHGLHTMRERAEELRGTFDAFAAPDGAGSVVRASFPLPPAKAVPPAPPLTAKVEVPL
ncbi:MAG TPA: histidine kinase [Jatrophihabitantaceae bacterium]|nr:histidine kinase [Jatrophihabitantaceae bacterium]